jgi:hypothetical protein
VPQKILLMSWEAQRTPFHYRDSRGKVKRGAAWGILPRESAEFSTGKGCIFYFSLASEWVANVQWGLCLGGILGAAPRYRDRVAETRGGRLKQLALTLA